MSKLDTYQKAKATHAAFVAALARIDNRQRCDKFGAQVQLSSTYIGDYGYSSTSPWDKALAEAVAVEFGRRLHEGVVWAVETAKHAMEQARQEAAAEAREVLQEVGR